MKRITFQFMRIFFLLGFIELILFILMIFFAMTDEPVSAVGNLSFFSLKYVLGFPMVLINESYPFFLHSQNAPSERLPLILVNNFLQASLILGLLKFLRRSRHSNT